MAATFARRFCRTSSPLPPCAVLPLSDRERYLPSESLTRRPCAHRPSISDRPVAALSSPNARWSQRRPHRDRPQKTNDTPTGQKGPTSDPSWRSVRRYAGGWHDIAIVPSVHTSGQNRETKNTGRNLRNHRQRLCGLIPRRFEVLLESRPCVRAHAAGPGRSRIAPRRTDQRCNRRCPSLTSLEHHCPSQTDGTECADRPARRSSADHKRTVRGNTLSPGVNP